MRPLILVIAMTLCVPASMANTVDLESEDSLAIHPSRRPHRHGPAARRPTRYRPAPRRHRRSSLYFGIGALGNFFLKSGDAAVKTYEGGGGFSIAGGVRFNKYGAFEFGYFTSFLETKNSGQTIEIKNALLQGVTMDGKLYLMPNMKRIEPYAQIGLGVYMLNERYERQLQGAGIHGGLGVDVRVSPFASLGTRILYRGFQVDDSENNYDQVATTSEFHNTVSVEANVMFHF